MNSSWVLQAFFLALVGSASDVTMTGGWAETFPGQLLQGMGKLSVHLALRSSCERLDAKPKWRDLVHLGLSVVKAKGGEDG